MRHQVDGRKFGRNTSHRVAMFKVMANNLIEHEAIVTTVAKAKEVRRVVDRLITLGKKGTLAAKRNAFAKTGDRDSVVKLFSTLAERYSKRPGGYTRVLRLDGTRWGDGAERAIIELVDRPMVEKKKKAKKAKAHDHDHGHDHSHDHDHDHDHKSDQPKEAKKPRLFDRGSKVQSATASKAKAMRSTTVRKTSSSSGGGKGGGSSS